MDTMFPNSRNSKTSDPHRLLLNFLDRMISKRNDKYVALSNFALSKLYMQKYKKVIQK